jgi:hypothetical protein
MNKLNRKIRNLRARFVTKLTKQTKRLSALDYSVEDYKQEKIWVDYHNNWYNFVGRNPKQSAGQISKMSVGKKNKFFFWLNSCYGIYNPYGNHFNEKFSMMVFVLSNPKSIKNLHINEKLLYRAFKAMQDVLEVDLKINQRPHTGM